MTWRGKLDMACMAKDMLCITWVKHCSTRCSLLQLSAALPAFLDLAGPEGAEAMDYDVSGPDEEQLGGAPGQLEACCACVNMQQQRGAPGGPCIGSAPAYTWMHGSLRRPASTLAESQHLRAQS